MVQTSKKQIYTDRDIHEINPIKINSGTGINESGLTEKINCGICINHQVYLTKNPTTTVAQTSMNQVITRKNPGKKHNGTEINISNPLEYRNSGLDTKLINEVNKRKFTIV